MCYIFKSARRSYDLFGWCRESFWVGGLQQEKTFHILTPTKFATNDQMAIVTGV